MTTVDELISRQRELNDAPTSTPEVSDAPPAAQSRIQKLIAAQAAMVDTTWEPLDVVLAKEIVTIDIGMTTGAAWGCMTALHPPTVEADAALGYDRETVPRDYPAERIKLAGRPTTTERWQAVYELLSDDDRTNVQAVMWWLHVGQPQSRYEQLARDAKRSGDAESHQPSSGSAADL